MRGLRSFCSLFPNNPLWDLVTHLEEWSLFSNTLASFEFANHFTFSIASTLSNNNDHPKDPLQDYREGTRGKTERILGASGWGSVLTPHIWLILPHMCICVTACAYMGPRLLGGKRQPQVSLFWSLLPWCFWGRASHWGLIKLSCLAGSLRNLPLLPPEHWNYIWLTIDLFFF